MGKNCSIIPIERIQQKIYLIRGEKVMLDFDLASFYEVTTFNMNKAVKRNLNRFPSDFMFRLSIQEVKDLLFQIGISRLQPTDNAKVLPQLTYGGRRYLPYAFTEAGVAMCSSVLKSTRAALVNVQIIRSFIKLREFLQSNESLSRRVADLEKTADAQAKAIMSIIRELEKPVGPSQRQKLGFG